MEANVKQPIDPPMSGPDENRTRRDWKKSIYITFPRGSAITKDLPLCDVSVALWEMTSGSRLCTGRDPRRTGVVPRPEDRTKLSDKRARGCVAASARILIDAGPEPREAKNNSAAARRRGLYGGNFTLLLDIGMRRTASLNPSNGIPENCSTDDST